MPPPERAYTQITNCRRISGGHIAQVALLPLKIWGGGPLGRLGNFFPLTEERDMFLYQFWTKQPGIGFDKHSISLVTVKYCAHTMITLFWTGFGKEFFSNKASLSRYKDISFFLTAPSSGEIFQQSNISPKQLSLPTEVRSSSLKKLKWSKFNSAHDEVIGLTALEMKTKIPWGPLPLVYIEIPFNQLK